MNSNCVCLFRFDLSKLTPAGTGKLTLNLLSNGYTVHKVSDMKTELTAWAVSQVLNHKLLLFINF